MVYPKFLGCSIARLGATASLLGYPDMFNSLMLSHWRLIYDIGRVVITVEMAIMHRVCRRSNAMQYQIDARSDQEGPIVHQLEIKGHIKSGLLCAFSAHPLETALCTYDQTVLLRYPTRLYHLLERWRHLFGIVIIRIGVNLFNVASCQAHYDLKISTFKRTKALPNLSLLFWIQQPGECVNGWPVIFAQTGLRAHQRSWPLHTIGGTVIFIARQCGLGEQYSALRSRGKVFYYLPLVDRLRDIVHMGIYCHPIEAGEVFSLRLLNGSCGELFGVSFNGPDKRSRPCLGPCGSIVFSS